MTTSKHTPAPWHRNINSKYPVFAGEAPNHTHIASVIPDMGDEMAFTDDDRKAEKVIFMQNDSKKIVRDSDLVTEMEIRERLESIRRQRDVRCDRPCRSNDIGSFRKKHDEIAKLTDREGMLADKLATILKARKS